MRLVRLGAAIVLALLILMGSPVLTWAGGKGGSKGGTLVSPTSTGPRLTAVEEDVSPDADSPPQRSRGDGSSAGTGAPQYPDWVWDNPGLIHGGMSPSEVLKSVCFQMSMTGGTDAACQPTERVPAVSGAPAVDPQRVARQAVLQLQIPEPVAMVGPDPKVNEWKMAVVGYPLWLWTTSPNTVERTVTEQGITLRLSARRVSTRFDMGDGTVKWCGYNTPYYPAVQPGAESPSCGHRYQEPSLPNRYRVSALTRWEVSWSALGQSGVLPFDRQGPVLLLPVGELVSVRTGG